MAMNFAAFDELRKEGILHGEMIWNFADFMTKQQVNRVVGNRKGTSFECWSQHLFRIITSKLIMWDHQPKQVHVQQEGNLHEAEAAQDVSARAARPLLEVGRGAVEQLDELSRNTHHIRNVLS